MTDLSSDDQATIARALSHAYSKAPGDWIRGKSPIKLVRQKTLEGANEALVMLADTGEGPHRYVAETALTRLRHLAGGGADTRGGPERGQLAGAADSVAVALARVTATITPGPQQGIADIRDALTAAGQATTDSARLAILEDLAGQVETLVNTLDPAGAPIEHTHEFQGQKLVHAHPSDHRHGYFEHPEDGNPYLQHEL